jgi:hypothetical protein
VRPALALVPLLALAALTACGSQAPEASGPSAGASASAPTLPTVQPCDALDASKVSAALGTTVTINTGSAASPICLLEDNATGTAFDMNYQWFYVNGLNAYFKTAQLPQGTLRDITVPGADAGKLIVNPRTKAYRATGYIQNGALVQSVNAAGPPADAARILAATKVILAELSAGAPSTPASLASPSPSS